MKKEAEVKRIIELYECSKKDNYKTLEIIRKVNDIEVLEELIYYAKSSEPLYNAKENYKYKSVSFTYGVNDINMQGFTNYRDRYFELRMMLAHNPSLTEGLVDILATDVNPYVLIELLYRDDISKMSLERIFRVLNGHNMLNDYEVVYRIFMNKNYDKEKICCMNVINDMASRKKGIPPIENWYMLYDDKLPIKMYLDLYWKFRFDVEQQADSEHYFFILSKVIEKEGNLSKDEIIAIYEKIKEIDDELRFSESMLVFFNVIDDDKIPAEVYNDFFKTTIGSYKDGIYNTLVYRGRDDFKPHQIVAILMLAFHSYADSEIMEKLIYLSSHNYWIGKWIGNALACDKLKRIDLINKYLENRCTTVDVYALLNSNIDFNDLSINVQQRMCEEPDENDLFSGVKIEKLCKLAKSDKTTTYMLEELSKSKNPLIQLALLENKNCTKAVYKNIYNNAYYNTNRTFLISDTDRYRKSYIVDKAEELFYKME